MDTARIESIPQAWDDARDVPFFTITAGVYMAAFVAGASVLLAANDPADDAFEPALVVARHTR
ncbi:MAG TPA: hypothetical protein VNQ77_04940 [Frankiaceae bacterium]|nr:hypothetical protein [Frankiaceae bacterium]